MALVYKNFLRLLEKWPVDPAKRSRDLGQYLREEVKVRFARPDCPDIPSAEECAKIYSSLNRIADNHYSKQYERRHSSSATGLSAQQCKGVLSDDFLEYLKDNNTSIFSRVFDKKK